MVQQNHIHIPTKQAYDLCDALVKMGVNATSEYFDGHKHVDIAILDAKMFIEVDGLQHLVDPDEIDRDLKREHFSDDEGFTTIHIPNIIVKYHLSEVAKAIEEVVKRRTSHV